MMWCALGGYCTAMARVGAGTAFSRVGSKKVAASGVEKGAGEETIVEGGINQSFLHWKAIIKAWKRGANGRWMGIHLLQQ